MRPVLKGKRTALHAVDRITFFQQQQLRQIGAVLAYGAGYESRFSHAIIRCPSFFFVEK